MATAVKPSYTNKITAGCYSSSGSLETVQILCYRAVVHKISFDRYYIKITKFLNINFKCWNTSFK